jgi:hypothetical protein
MRQRNYEKKSLSMAYLSELDYCLGEGLQGLVMMVLVGSCDCGSDSKSDVSPPQFSSQICAGDECG